MTQFKKECKRFKLLRSFQVPIIIPVVVLVISAYLVVGPIIDKPQIEYLYTVLFILCGLVMYLPFVRWQMHPPFMSKFVTEIY